MPETVDQLLGKVRRACQPEFRFRLLSRGAARALTWREGVLPADAPPFAGRGNLDQDLSGFAFALLRIALLLFELGETGAETRNAFDHSSRALEAMVSNGDPAFPDRPFYITMAACAAHLAKFSARACSLLDRDDAVRSWPIGIRALRLLIMRRFDLLYTLCLENLIEPDEADDRSVSEFESGQESACGESLVIELLEENYLRALAGFMFAVKTGRAESHVAAQERLVDGETMAGDFNVVVFWWLFRITRMLLDDLWAASLHEILPTLPGATETRWNELRKDFISLLAARKAAEVELWPSQIEAAQRIVNDNDDLVAGLPTSAGKTRIAELAVLRALSCERRVAFVTPLRALSAQTEHSLAQLFRPLGARVSALYGGVVNSEEESARLSEANITVCTPEKLDFALRNNPGVLDDVGLIVLDEGHMLGFGERQVRYEVLIQRLLRREDAGTRRIVCLSAMLPDDTTRTDLISWLRAGEEGEGVISPWTPTRKVYGSIEWAGTQGDYKVETGGEKTFLNRFVSLSDKFGPRGGRKVFPNNAQQFTLSCAAKLLDEGRSVLIYCAQRSEVEGIAGTFSSAIENGWLNPFPIEAKDREEISRHCRSLQEWLGAGHSVIGALQNGLAVHHARLPRPVLHVMDDLLRRRVIKTVVASPTLAQGLNLAASCVLFHSVERFNPSTEQRDMIRPDEFLNVAGRAGRAFVDVEGQVLGACFTEAQKLAWRRVMANQKVTAVESGLLLVADKLLHLLMRMLGRYDVGEYILNNSAIWESPALRAKADEEEREALAILDIALLTLLGDSGQDANAIAEVLDQVLENSFLRRRLAHRTEAQRERIEAVIESRARYIWSSTTPKQRRSWHLAGIGLEDGLKFKDQAPALIEKLVAAEAAFDVADTAATITNILGFADIAWKLDPFSPFNLPSDAEEITKGWLLGTSVAELATAGQEVGEFIEDALVYRLTWAIEATRIWFNTEDEENSSDEPSPLVPCVEHGTLNKTALVFLNAGLRSRTAAELVARNATSVTNTRTLRRWLKKLEIRELSKDEEFPTPDTHFQWQQFVEEFLSSKVSIAQRESEILTAEWNDDADAPEHCLAISRDEGRWDLYTDDLRLVGAATSENSVERATIWTAEQVLSDSLNATRWKIPR